MLCDVSNYHTFALVGNLLAIAGKLFADAVEAGTATTSVSALFGERGAEACPFLF